MVFITGDTHSDFSRFSSKNFPLGRSLTKQDYVIILGDFGGIWHQPGSKGWDTEVHNLEWLNSKHWTTLFIDGNHESFDRLFQFPKIKMFNSVVRTVMDSIYYLQRGHIYTIENKTFFCFGGAKSIDKEYRIEGLSWWKEELPNKIEMDLGIDNLEKTGNKIDYILTHTAPKQVIHLMGYRMYDVYNESKLYENDKYNDPTSKYLDHIHQITNFQHWYFGHFHENKINFNNQFTTLYQKIIKII